MRNLLRLLMLLTGCALTPGLAHAANFPISAGASTATIQSTINSAAAASGGNTVTFAAGSYLITSQINIPCPSSALTITGPTPTGAPTNLSTGQGATWPITPTAVLTGSITNNFGFKTAACNTAVTIQYLEWNGGEPSGGGGGFLFVAQNTNNLTVWWNFLHGTYAVQTTVHDYDAVVYMDGPQGQPSIRDANVTFQWNRFGTTGSNDCGGLMNEQGGSTATNQTGPSCFVTVNGGGYVLDGIKGPGVTKGACWYQVSASEKDAGGQCTGIGIHVNTDNLVIANNTFQTLEQGLKFYEAGSSVPNIYNPTNVLVDRNDFAGIHRIALEAQYMSGTYQSTNLMTVSNNSEHDWTMAGGVSWALSLPQGGPTNSTNNIEILNNNNNGRDKYGFGLAGSAATEFWGNASTTNHNLIQGYFSSGIDWGFGGGGWLISNNTIQMIGSTGYITDEEGCTSCGNPVGTGNVTGGSVSSVTSVAPAISPAGGSQAFPLTVTLSDPGYTSGAVPQGNTGIWYTIDGTTPVPGSGSAKYLSSGQTFVLPAAATVQAVGMWGALNQPTSYASGYGFVPSAVVLAAYTTGGAATLTSATIAPTGGVSTLQAGGTVQMIVICHYSDGSTSGCNTTDAHGNSVTSWASSSGNVTINSSGLATGAAVGTAIVTATVTGGTVTSPGSTLTVSASPLTLSSVSLATTGGVSTIAVPATNQLLSTCHYNDGSATACNSTDSHGNAVSSATSSARPLPPSPVPGPC